MTNASTQDGFEMELSVCSIIINNFAGVGWGLELYSILQQQIMKAIHAVAALLKNVGKKVGDDVEEGMVQFLGVMT